MNNDDDIFQEFNCNESINGEDSLDGPLMEIRADFTRWVDEFIAQYLPALLDLSEK